MTDAHPTAAPVTRRPWRYTRVGAIVLSPDFYVGVPLGLAVAVLPTASRAVAASGQTVLLGLSATAAALTGLVLTSVSVLVGAITPAFGKLLELLPNGLDGLLRPYRWIVAVSVSSCGAGLLAALAWPLVISIWQLRLLAMSVPLALLLWALGGCIQIIDLTAKTLQRARQADRLDERMHNLDSRRASG